jgi:hypothetical protein
MAIGGLFHDRDDADRFVWMRGFPSMETRRGALGAFYGGPVWKEHRDAANATMKAFDDVLLLRPARAGSGFVLENLDRPPRGADEVRRGFVVAAIHDLAGADLGGFVDFFEAELRPTLVDAGASILAYFVTESSPNDYPALPVREGESVFVWFSCFPDEAAWLPSALPLGVRAELRRLAPTPRSRLRC